MARRKKPGELGYIDPDTGIVNAGQAVPIFIPGSKASGQPIKAIALISECDVERVSKAIASVKRGSQLWIDSCGYVQVGLQYLHTIIAGRRRGCVVDHIDGEKLYCTRANLQHISQAENTQKGLGRKTNTGELGISRQASGRYRVQFRDTHEVFDNMFSGLEEAVAARDAYLTRRRSRQWTQDGYPPVQPSEFSGGSLDDYEKWDARMNEKFSRGSK